MAERKGNGRSSSRRTRRSDEFADYSILDPRDLPPGPDVLLDVPVVKVDEIDIEVDDLRAQVAVLAEVRDLVQISVGADVSLGKVELKIEGVEAQVLLKARLDNVSLILERVLTTLDRNPQLLESLGRTVEQVGEGGGRLLSETGEAIDEIGEGAEGAVEDVGRGAGQAVGEVGEGAGEAVQQVGQGAQRGVADLGGGTARGVSQADQGAGRGVAGAGQGARQATEGLAQGDPPSEGKTGKGG
ncbi:MAG TPA: hypothetical protein VE972_00970 [Conexibacter sp.]|nr:hypothetical protein [Conexibacter sp.]